MPYNPNGSFSILNEISTGYACNNALPPLIGADLDDIATGIGKASITSNILTGLIAQSRNSTLLNAGVLPPATFTQVLQIGPCSLQTGDLLIADSFIDVLSNEATNTRHAENYLFISTNPAATAPAMSSDNIGGDALNYYIDIVAGDTVTLTASGTAIVSSSGTYYLTNAIFWATAAANNASAGGNNSFGINLVRIRLPLGTI